MTKLASIAVAVSLALTASFAASAQDADTNATLRVDTGSVMTSEGGEFATAQTGKRVETGDRLMVHEKSAVTVIFDKDCERQYTAPGVYTIVRACELVPAAAGAAAAANATGFDVVGAATVVAGSVGVAAILHNMDQSDERPPVQPVSR